MPQKVHYKTKQMSVLLDYLRTTQGQHITAQQICADLQAQGVTMGTATVYRHLERMVEQGLVAKYVVDGTTSACFEFLGEQHAAAQACYHCKCEQCGALIHLHCEEVQALRSHMLADHGFALDPRRTVFYGVCAQCRAAQASPTPHT